MKRRKKDSSRHWMILLVILFSLLQSFHCLTLMDSELNYVPSDSTSTSSSEDNSNLEASSRSDQGLRKCPRPRPEFHFGLEEPELFCRIEDSPKIPDPIAKEENQIEAQLNLELAPPSISTGTQAEIPAPPPPPPKPKENAQNSEPEVAQKKEEERYIVRATPRQEPIKTESSTQTEVVSTQDDGSTEVKVTEPIVEEVAGEASNETVSDEHVARTTNETESVLKEEQNKTEPEIPSFREWSQKALEEEEKKKEEEKRKKEEEKKLQQAKLQKQTLGNGEGSGEGNDTLVPEVPTPSPALMKSLKKNFASLDCGAKVVSANAESNGASNIISPSRDEYMLNKCTDKAWFVVELCESIKALKIELANFELYSSVPHEFKVSLVNTFPAREKDWVPFGSFAAQEERSIQSFTSPEGVFGKYAKVEILSHHGSEHYCPVSLFRIYGISEIELIGGDEDEEEEEVDLGVREGEEELEKRKIEEEKKASGFVDSFIKTFGQTIEKVVGIFRPGKKLDINAALNETSLVGNSFMFNFSCPDCDIQRYRDVYFLLATNYPSLLATLRNAPLKKALETWFCKENGFEFPVPSDEKTREIFQDSSTQTCTGISSQTMEFYRTIFGSSQVIALCNVLAVERGLLDRVQGEDANVISGISAPKVDSDAKDIGNALETAPMGGNQIEDRSLPGNNGSLTESKSESSSKSTSQPEVEANQATTSEDKDPKEPKESETAPKTEGSKSQTGEEDKNPELKQESETEVKKEDSSKGQNSETETKSGAEKDGKDPSKQGNNIPKPQEPSEMRNPPPVVHVTPSTASHISTGTNTAKAAGSNAGAGSQQQRESVWQKLSNKIKTLERDVTLSSGYLEELSVRYKKQIEDIQFSAKQNAEAISQTIVNRAEDKAVMDEMKDQIKHLSTTLSNMETKFETYAIWAIGFHVILVFVETVIGAFFFFACRSRINGNEQGNKTRRQSVSFGSPPRERIEVKYSTPLKSEVTIDNRDRQVRPSFEIGGSEEVKERRRNSLGSAFSNLTKKQRKRLNRKLNKVASTGKMQDLHIEFDGDEDSAYHTYHPGENPGRKGMRKLQQNAGWKQKDSDSDSEEIPSSKLSNSSKQRSRFRVQTVTPPSPRGVKVKNKFEVLNSSLHDDPTPIKERALNYEPRRVQLLANGFHGETTGTESDFDENLWGELTPSGNELPPDECWSRKSRKRLKFGQVVRSKSTSPTRMGQTAKTKVLFKNFNPDKAEWIQKKS